jgi:hypothetical protein
MTHDADRSRWQAYQAWIADVQRDYPDHEITETPQGVEIELDDGSVIEIEYRR